jgi:glutathione S-transferase
VKTPVLYHLTISHFNEKARWALDYKGVQHVRKALPPLLHMAWALALTRGPTLPVLKLDGKAIGDSTRIIEALERRYPEPPLYPEDPLERRRALELEDFFDEELGPYIRRYFFYEVLEGLEPEDYLGGALGNQPAMVKRAIIVAAPLSSRITRLRYGIQPERARAARQKTGAAFDRLEGELQPTGYLVGDGFTVADLTAAALFFPLVRPPEAPYEFRGPLPDALVRFRDEMSSRPGFEWVLEMYRRHRGSSAQIAAGRARAAAAA